MSAPEIWAAVLAERRRQRIERILEQLRWGIWQATKKRLDEEEAAARAVMEQPDLLEELSKPLREAMRREVDRVAERMRTQVEEEVDRMMAREEKMRRLLPPSGGSLLRMAGVPEEEVRKWEEQSELARAWMEEIRVEKERNNRKDRRGVPKKRFGTSPRGLPGARSSDDDHRRSSGRKGTC